MIPITISPISPNRYQEPIYIQNGYGVRNRDLLNVNMSSDMCVFTPPEFTISGASKIDCIVTTTGSSLSMYSITTATTIPLEFIFTAHTETFTNNSATFKFEIYKYKPITQIFANPPVYQSGVITYASISGTSATTQEIPINVLGLDGEYLVKTYFQFPVCTDFLNKLGKGVDTLQYSSGSQYGLYDGELDFYFLAITPADTPTFTPNGSNSAGQNQLFQEVKYQRGGDTEIVLSNPNNGYFVLTLNGLVLAPILDYTYTGSVITLSAVTVSGDVITAFYSSNGGSTIVGDNIYVTSAVPSGATDGQGSSSTYFNTDTGKYEIYTNVEPVRDSVILVMINGVTLANGVDYYKSISNSKRVILEGNILIGDVITMVYYPTTTVINDIQVTNPSVSWVIQHTPQLVNGVFTLEVSTDPAFLALYYSTTVDYVVNQNYYTSTFPVSGTIGTNLYYRIKNEKNFENICGQLVYSVAYSDVIPMVITTNAINSY